MQHQPSPDRPFYAGDEPALTLHSVNPSSEPGGQTGEYYLGLGDRHYNSYLTRSARRDLDTAIQHYRRALEVNPKLPAAYVKLATALWDKGEINVEAAIGYCQKALQHDPENADAHLSLGYFYRKAGHLDIALFQFEMAISSAPVKSAKARVALGTALIQKAIAEPKGILPARLTMALRGTGQVLAGMALLPLDSRACTLIQQALSDDVKVYSVLGAARACRLLGLNDWTATCYRWASQRMPEEPVFYHHLGDLYVAMERADASLYYYTRAAELEPDNIALHKKLARAYVTCNDVDGAAKSLEKAVQVVPEDFETLYQLAQVHTERKDYIKALYYFKETLRHQPKNPYAHSNMAYVLFKLDDIDGAIEQYREAVNLGEDPQWTATVAQTVGTILYQVRRDVEAAIGMFQVAHQLNPGNLECQAMLADLHFEQGNLHGALAIYRQILRIQPDNADCHNYVGYLLWQMDRNEEAIEAYREALRLDPDNAIAFNNLGVIYLDEFANPARALEHFEKALRLKADYTLACFNIGRACEALGDTAEAARHYSETLGLNAEHPELSHEEILERLDSLFQA